MKKQSSSNADCQQDTIEHSLSLTSTASTVSSGNSSQSFPSKGSEPSSRKPSHKSSHSLSLPSSTRRFRSRSKSPAPSDIYIDRQRHSPPRTNSRDTPSRSLDMSRRCASPVQMSPLSSMSPDRSDHRKSEAGARHSRATSDDYRRYNGTVNHYGRHSNDWLFGGFSLRNTVRDGVEKIRHHGREG